MCYFSLHAQYVRKATEREELVKVMYPSGHHVLASNDVHSVAVCIVPGTNIVIDEVAMFGCYVRTSAYERWNGKENVTVQYREHGGVDMFMFPNGDLVPFHAFMDGTTFGIGRQTLEDKLGLDTMAQVKGDDVCDPETVTVEAEFVEVK